MASPELQTVLTLTSGTSDQKTKTFRWGTAVPPIPVGTRAEWYVHAPGVVGVHIYVAFDGRMVHVAAAAGARVTVRGVEVGQEWTSVPVRTACLPVLILKLPACASAFSAIRCPSGRKRCRRECSFVRHERHRPSPIPTAI